MTSALIALGSLCATLLLALIGAVWKFASLSATMQATIGHLQTGLEKVNIGLKALEEIPTLRQNIRQLENLYAHTATMYERMRSDITELKTEIALMQGRNSYSVDNDD